MNFDKGLCNVFQFIILRSYGLLNGCNLLFFPIPKCVVLFPFLRNELFWNENCLLFYFPCKFYKEGMLLWSMCLIFLSVYYTTIEVKLLLILLFMEIIHYLSLFRYSLSSNYMCLNVVNNHYWLCLLFYWFMTTYK